jgi:CRISPR-associated exonuclease Cas4
MQSEVEQASEERLRLLYVACTRAMDLLVLPELAWSDEASWARAVDFRLHALPELNLTQLRVKPFGRRAAGANAQTPEVFAAEQAVVAQALRPLRWIRPSAGDAEVLPLEMPVAVAWDQPMDMEAASPGGPVRGIILHKLMEELLTGELVGTDAALRDRCSRLASQLSGDDGGARVDLDELVATTLRTWSLPELGDGRNNTVPEVPIYGRLPGADERLVSGRADAVRYRGGRPETVFDWKSDVAPEAGTRRAYAQQLAQYVHVLGAERGAIVYMSTGQIQWVEVSGNGGTV